MTVEGRLHLRLKGRNMEDILMDEGINPQIQDKEDTRRDQNSRIHALLRSTWRVTAAIIMAINFAAADMGAPAKRQHQA